MCIPRRHAGIFLLSGLLAALCGCGDSAGDAASGGGPEGAEERGADAGRSAGDGSGETGNEDASGDGDAESAGGDSSDGAGDPSAAGDGDNADGTQPAGDGDGDGVPSDPVATPVTPERVFKDDPATAFSVLDGMGFWCGLPGAEDGYLIGFEGASSLSVEYYEGSSDQMPDIGSGSYSVAGTRVTLDIPALMFNASSDDFAVALDRVVAFQFSAEGLVCSARVLDLSMSSDAQVFECPTIAFVPGAGFDNNEFQMALNGRVLRRRWKEITVGDGDTLYREFRGIYVIEQGSVFMVFPEADEAVDQLLYGPVASDLSQFTVEQLEPDKGPCVAK